MRFAGKRVAKLDEQAVVRDDRFEAERVVLEAARVVGVEVFDLFEQPLHGTERHGRAAALVAQKAGRERAERGRSGTLLGEQERAQARGVERVAGAAWNGVGQRFFQRRPAVA